MGMFSFGEVLRSRSARAVTRTALVLQAAVLTLGIAHSSSTQADTIAALPVTGLSIEKTGAAKPVAAWTGFCERFASECGVDVREPERLQLTTQAWRTITTINRRVNARIQPLTDKEHWKLADQWDFPDNGYGDCEDYQLLKRKMLVESGLPRRALRMTVVIDELGEGHAVLMVRTDRGDFILDNKNNSVLPWNQTGYVYIKREGSDSLAWVSLGGRSSPVTTANR